MGASVLSTVSEVESGDLTGRKGRSTSYSDEKKNIYKSQLFQ